ncbi:15683_t:CDS:2, partial [Racocetra persica]
HTSSFYRNDTALLAQKDLFSIYNSNKRKSFYLIIDIDARQKPDSTNPKQPFLEDKKITQEDLLSRILVA